MFFEGYNVTTLSPAIFMSHARLERAELVLPIVRRLSRLFHIWIDKSMHPGDNFDETLLQRIENCSAMIVFLTPQAVRDESWVHKEIQIAVDHGKPIIPVMLKNSSLPLVLKNIHYITLRNKDDDNFGELIDALNEKASSSRINRGVKSEYHRQNDANHRQFQEMGGSVEGVLKFDHVGDRVLMGLPIDFSRYHAVYLVGFGDDSLERTETMQVVLQSTSDAPGDDLALTVAKWVAKPVEDEGPRRLRMVLIRGLRGESKHSNYDYSSKYKQEWQDAVDVVREVIANTYQIKPNHVELFLKAPTALAFQLAIALADLKKSVKFTVYHFNEDTKDYISIFPSGDRV